MVWHIAHSSVFLDLDPGYEEIPRYHGDTLLLFQC